MKILYYDCFSGISGDMNLGALLDLGIVDAAYLEKGLSGLGLDSEFSISAEKCQKNGITGTKANVVLRNTDPSAHHIPRHLDDITAILDASRLSDAVKQSSLRMFRAIAQAEGKVHGIPAEKVHFHEVGATDSVVDIVGAAVLLDALRPDRILSSPVQVGGGYVECAHGLIPVPAPATAELLRGIPVRLGLVPFETATPTGAAILACSASEFTDRMTFTAERIGYGFGDRDFKIPNALRVFWGEVPENETVEEQTLLETNIDDMNPEFYEYVEKLLFQAGALDVFKTPIVMKKGRPAVKLSVLAARKDECAVTDVIFRQTTSIGLRKTGVEKVMLRRREHTLNTKYGEISVKEAYYEGKPLKYKAEYEDCRKAAEAYGVPLAEVRREIDRVMEAQNG